LCYSKYNDSLFDLPQHGKIIAEYVWIDGSGINLRSKARTLDKKVERIEDVPEWNYDGSSTYQAVTDQSEIILRPVAVFRDPFRRGDNIIVMCETFRWEDNTCKKLIPANTNFRTFATQVWNDPAVSAEKPWYGIEQEYTILSQSTKFTKQPLGWPNNGYPGAQGPYYCSIGANVCFGRAISDAHYKACIFAGVRISGTNGEVMPG
jgi:glutamine synthetase